MITVDCSAMHEPQNSDAEALTIEQAIANLQGDDLGLRVYAAWWLGRFRVHQPEAIEVLISALTDEADRTEDGGYPLRRNAARALGKLGDGSAVPALIRSLNCSDYYVREAAVQALEQLGDSQAIPPIIQLLKDTSTHPEQETKAHGPQPYDSILEALGSLGAQDAIDLIQDFLDHPLPRVQFSAARALYQLTSNPRDANQSNPYGDRLVKALKDGNLQLRRSALSDLGAVGYFPAAEPIAETLAENSLKLIALQGLLSKQVMGEHPPTLSPEAEKIMALMDDLL